MKASVQCTESLNHGSGLEALELQDLSRLRCAQDARPDGARKDECAAFGRGGSKMEKTPTLPEKVQAWTLRASKSSPLPCFPCGLPTGKTSIPITILKPRPHPSPQIPKTHVAQAPTHSNSAGLFDSIPLVAFIWRTYQNRFAATLLLLLSQPPFPVHLATSQSVACCERSSDRSTISTGSVLRKSEKHMGATVPPTA